MKIRALTLFGATTLLMLGACAKQESVREIDWAKEALARNPAYEILATDDVKGVFTVRDTSTGSVRMLRIEQLMATPLPTKGVVAPALAANPAAAVDAAEQAAPESAPQAESPTSSQTTDVVKAQSAASGEALASGPGYSITRGNGSTPAAASATLDGPGYSITRQGPRQRHDAPVADTMGSNVEHRTDPIICQGDRLMRIDGEVLDFSGDALIAERGCDLYISNARIRAGGIGIIARQARVHIVNSTIGGTRGSYEASEGAEIYVARSTFTGVGRRFDSASMNDLGGNQYQSH